MSIQSKARRDAHRRKAERERNLQPKPAPIEPHAELRDRDRRLLAGIVRREGEWVLGMGGRIAGGTDSAAHVLAMIRRAALLHEAQGTPVRLTWSDALKDAAHAEAAEQGMTFEEFEARLEQSMIAAMVEADNTP